MSLFGGKKKDDDENTFDKLFGQGKDDINIEDLKDIMKIGKEATKIHQTSIALLHAIRKRGLGKVLEELRAVSTLPEDFHPTEEQLDDVYNSLIQGNKLISKMLKKMP